MAIRSNNTEAKKLDIVLDHDFPFILKTNYGVSKAAAALHWHDYIQICFMRKGSGRYLINGKNHTFAEGDIFIINSNEMHLTRGTGDMAMTVLDFRPEILWNASGLPFEINYLMPFWEAGKSYSNKLVSGSELYNRVVEVILEMEMEYISKSNGYMLMIKSLLLKLSATLERYINIGDDKKLSAKIKNYNLLTSVFDYISQNYSRKIKLQQLADIVNMSVSNFSLVFKNSVGITPMEYIVRFRIAKACEIMLKSNVKVIDVAYDCGFSSMSHFIENFKKHTGQLPRDFRK